MEVTDSPALVMCLDIPWLVMIKGKSNGRACSISSSNGDRTPGIESVDDCGGPLGTLCEPRNKVLTLQSIWKEHTGNCSLVCKLLELPAVHSTKSVQNINSKQRV